MSERKQTILIGAIFIIGLLVMCYPTLSNWYNELVGSYSITEYKEAVSSNITEEEYEQMFEEARAFNDTVSGQPEDFEKGEAKDQEYQDALNVLDGMMGYLIIDKIDLRLPIYHGTLESTLQKSLGHLEGSHLPTGDIGNSTVITGHTGLPSAELFTRISELEIGDTFQVSVLDKIFTYEVFEINVVLPTELDVLIPREDIDMVTLVTCTPYGVNSHRLMIHGKQIAVSDKEEVTPSVASTAKNAFLGLSEYDLLEGVIILIGALIFFVFIFIILVLRDSRRIKKFMKKHKKPKKKKLKDKKSKKKQ